MYLSKLSLKQRKAFLEASLRIATSDGQFAKQEYDLIMQQAEEMGIKFKKDADLDFDAAVIELNGGSTLTQRKQILFELTRVAYADFVIKPREEQMLKFVVDTFKLSQADYAKVTAMVKDLAKTLRDLNTYFAG